MNDRQQRRQANPLPAWAGRATGRLLNRTESVRGNLRNSNINANALTDGKEKRREPVRPSSCCLPLDGG